MSHEKTKGLEFEGKEHVFPSVDPKTGADLSADEIAKRFRAGKLKPIRVFNSREEAEAFSKERSKSFADAEEDSQFEDNF